MSASDVDAYLTALPDKRRDRLQRIRARFMRTLKGVEESMRYRMPTFERGDRWVCIGNQKAHVSVYFCSEALVAPIRAAHPELSYGKGCVRIRDSKDVPIDALVRAFRQAMKKKE